MADKDEVKKLFEQAKESHQWEIFKTAMTAATELQMESARSFSLLRALVLAGFTRREAFEIVGAYLNDALAQKYYVRGDDEPPD